MVLLKLLPLLIPLLIYLLTKMARAYVSKIIFTKQNRKSEQMLSCSVCGTYVHESLVIKKYGNSYCSKDCSKS